MVPLVEATRSPGTVEAIRGAIGQTLGPSRWVTLDQARIDSFAAATEDRQWIHVDPERSRTGPFGHTIAHGYLTLSLVTLILSELLHLEDIPMAINYGLDRVRFPAPVAVASRVRGRAALEDLTEAPLGLLLRSRVVVEIDGHQKPACVADSLTLFPTRSEES